MAILILPAQLTPEPSFWSLIATTKPIPLAVLLVLVAASLLSWAIIFNKWSSLRRARKENRKFLGMFRKATGFDVIAAACEQFPNAPLVSVYDFGYAEVDRQVRGRNRLSNRTAVERSLQIGAGEQIAILERHLNWLATTAAVSPFVGLFGTVWGIIDAFRALSVAGSASMRAVGPGIADALVATALGLLAAIPAAVFYNYFGNLVREFGSRMEDFSLEFLNLVERVYEG